MESFLSTAPFCVNRSSGSNWKAVPQRFSSALLRKLPDYGKASIFISCVDTIAARFDIAPCIRNAQGQQGI